MASRQNREARAEYPTGHNRGNDSPDRRVPRVPGGANPVEAAPPPKAYGAPMGTPEVSEEDKAARLAEREELLGTPGTREEFQAAVTEQEEGSIAETKRAELEAKADARTAAVAPSSPTADLSAAGAMKTLEEMKRRTEEEGRQ